jgi:hypothetical protein
MTGSSSNTSRALIATLTSLLLRTEKSFLQTKLKKLSIEIIFIQTFKTTGKISERSSAIRFKSKNARQYMI